MIAAAALLFVAAVSAADIAIPLDYVLVGTDAVLNADAHLSRDVGAVSTVADCAALCSRDEHCESLVFSQSHCVLYTVRPCQSGGLIPSANGVLVLEKAANVAIGKDRVLIRDSACAHYENGTVLDSSTSQVPATFDDAMNSAVADYTATCRTHCAQTTFCLSYAVQMSWDAVPAHVDLRCTTYSTSVYSGDGSAVRISQCDRKQLTYGIVGAAVSAPNCGRPLSSPPPSGAAGAPVGYALVATNEFIDADPMADTFGALSASSCAALCERDSTCQAFTYSAQAQRCQLYPVRHCMVAYSGKMGSWVIFGDVYERVNPVTVPADRIIFDADCGGYNGVQIGSADVSNYTDQAQICRQLCAASQQSNSECQSWEVQALAPHNATCRLFADSLFRTEPLGGYYSTRRGTCATAPWPHSTYGLIVPTTSILNCGQPLDSSLVKSGGGGGNNVAQPANKPAAPGPAPPVRQAAATPSPQEPDADSSSQSAVSSVLVLVVGIVLGLVLV